MVLLISRTSNAQLSLGISSGYTRNSLYTAISNENGTKIQNRDGGYLGLFIMHDVMSFLSVRSGIDLIQKNYRFAGTDYSKGSFETFKNLYVQLPVTLQLKIFEKKRLSLGYNLGLYAGYWVDAHVKGAIPNVFDTSNAIGNDGEPVQYFSYTTYSEKYQFSTVKDNRFEFGLHTGASIYYKLNSQHSVFLNLEFYQSITDQQKKYMANQIGRKNQTFCISLGYLVVLDMK